MSFWRKKAVYWRGEYRKAHAALCGERVRGSTLRLFMQLPMSCGHMVGNLLTCDMPPAGCVICGEPPRRAGGEGVTDIACPVCGQPHEGTACPPKPDRVHPSDYERESFWEGAIGPIAEAEAREKGVKT